MKYSYGVLYNGAVAGGSGDFTGQRIGTGLYKVSNPAWPANAVVILSADYNPNRTCVANITAQAAGSFTGETFNCINGGNLDTFLFFLVFW